MFIFKNEKGGALIYVLVIVIVLGVFSPVILNSIFANESTERRNELESKSIQLTVSGMEAFIHYSEDPLEQRDYLIDNYGMTEIQIPEGQTIEYRQFLVPPMTDDADVLKPEHFLEAANIGYEPYRLVITAAVGSSVKTLIRDVEFSPTEITDLPFIKQLIDGDTEVRGTSEPNADITVWRNETIIGTGTANGLLMNGVQEYAVSTPVLAQGEIIYVTAKAGLELASPKVSRVVQAISADPETGGYVIVEDEEGNITYEQFDSSPETPYSGTLTVTSSVNGENNEGYITDSNIDLQADEGIVIEEGVKLSTTSNGADAGLSLQSSGGDVVLKGTDLTNTGNSQFSDITIVAAGDVDLRGAKIIAERDISITAGGNIYAQGAMLTSNKNDITLTLNPNTGTIFVENLTLNKNGMAGPAGVDICGTLSPGSTMNGLNNHGLCP